MKRSATPSENCPDNSIEEAPLTFSSHAQEFSLTGTLSGSSRLELIDDDDGPPLPSIMREIKSDPEVLGMPSANLCNLVPPRTSPPVMDIDHIETGDDDDDNGLELLPSLIPPVTLEVKENGSNSTKSRSAASDSNVEIIDDNEDDTREFIKCIDQVNYDDYKLASKHESEYSRESDFNKKTTESRTQNETFSYGEDFISSHVNDIVVDVHSHRTGVVINWELDPENPIRPSSSNPGVTSPGVSRVPGIHSDAIADFFEIDDAVSRTSVPEAIPVTAMMREENEDESLVIASRLDPWLRRRRLRQIVVTILIVLAGSGIAYGITLRKSEFGIPPRYACLANLDCDDGIWCNGDETCNELGVCQLGAPRTCSDGLSCTDDVCNEFSKTCENPATDCMASDDPCATGICIESLNGCQFTCGATVDTWLDVEGVSIINLMTTINSGVAPNITERLGSFLESPHKFDADYGSRIMGWLVPPTSGDYVFWIAADTLSELWLSSDENPENKVLLCNPSTATAPRVFVYPSQKSKPIGLVADRVYYFESYVKVAKEKILGNATGYLAIAWQYPGQALELIPAGYSRMTRPTLLLPQL